MPPDDQYWLEMKTDTTTGRGEGKPTLWIDCAKGMSIEEALLTVKKKIGEEASVTILYGDEDGEPPELFGWKYIISTEFHGSEDEVSESL